RSQTFIDLFRFFEVLFAHFEERQLVRRQASERSAGSRRSAAHSGVMSSVERLRRDVLCLEREETSDDQDRKYKKPLPDETCHAFLLWSGHRDGRIELNSSVDRQASMASSPPLRRNAFNVQVLTTELRWTARPS